MQVALVMVKADGSSRELPLDREVTVIGRDEHARLRIPVPQVSRKHCEVVVKDPKVQVRDVGSSNGTYVNGRKVREADLTPGDLITVGPVVFVVKINGEPGKIDAKDCYAAGTVGLDDDDDDDLPGAAAAPTTKMMGGPVAGGGGGAGAGGSAGGKGTVGGGGAGKPSIFEEDDEDGDLGDILKDFKFDDDDDDDDGPAKKK